jgi:hypothetical protein
MSGDDMCENEDFAPGAGLSGPKKDTARRRPLPAPPDGADENKPLRLRLTGYRLFDDPYD